MDSTVINSPWGLLVKVFRIVFLLDRSEQRVSRGQYWIGSALLSFVGSIFSLLGIVFSSSMVGRIISLISLLLMGLGLVLFAKRLRDLNMSVWWIAPFVFFYLSLGAFILYLIYLGGIGGFSNIFDFFSGDYATILIVLYSLIGGIILIIGYRLSFYKSVNDNNKYGPDPLRNITVTNPSYRLIVIVLLLLGSFLDFLGKGITELSPEEQLQLEQSMDDRGETGEYTNEDSTGGFLGSLDNIQNRAEDVAKKSDINQISAALRTYNLDFKPYPQYTSFVDTTTILSGELSVGGNYLGIMPDPIGTYYYKSISKGGGDNQGFILAAQLSTNPDANFFGTLDDINALSFEQLQEKITAGAINTGSQQARYVVIQ